MDDDYFRNPTLLQNSYKFLLQRAQTTYDHTHQQK